MMWNRREGFMKTLDQTPTLYQPEKAVAVAAEYKTGDPDWEYRVVHDSTGQGYSFVEVYDEDGYMIGHL